MQRRAAAIYTVLFVVIAAGAYTMIGTAQEPTVSLQNPDHSLGVGQSVDINDRTYTVTSIQDGSARLAWVNESAEYTETWSNGSTVTLDETDFTVIVAEGEEPTSATLQEVQELGEDVTTVETGGTTYVVIESGGEQVLVPRSDYLRQEQGEPARRTVAVGDQLAYQNNTVTVARVLSGGVELEWVAPRENIVRMSEGDVVTLNGQEFVTHFPDANTLELSTDVEAYNTQVQTVDTYHERINGLWGVSILSGLGAMLTLAMAFMPSRY